MSTTVLSGEDIEKLQKLMELLKIQSTTKLETPLVEFTPMLILVNNTQDAHIIFSSVRAPSLGKVKAVHIYVSAPALNLNVDKLFSVDNIVQLLERIKENREYAATKNIEPDKVDTLQPDINSIGIIFELFGKKDVTIRARLAIDIPKSTFGAIEKFCHRVLKYWDIEERKNYETDDFLLKGETIVISDTSKN